MTGLLGLALTTQGAYEVLLPEGWTQFDTVRNLSELAALSAGNGKRVLVLDQSELYTLNTSNAATPDGLRIVASKVGAGNWLLFQAVFDRLWVTQRSVDLKVYGFTAQQATETPSGAPITITLPNLGPADGHTRRVSSLCFHSSGDLVVGYSDITVPANNGQSVARIAASSLVASGSPSPLYSFAVTTPTAVPTTGIKAMSFGVGGFNLWLAMAPSASAPGGLLRYSTPQFNTGNIPALDPRSISQAGIANSVDDLFFDAAGNLWFCNALAGTVNRLTAAQLLASNNAIVPDIILSIGSYTSCTLDKYGNLWCATTGFADMYAVADIQSTGTPTPTRRVGTGSLLGQSPKLRFSPDGSLWVSAGAGVAGYPPTDILATGSPAPSTRLTGAGALTAAGPLNFNPATFA